jgi:hypothetical protein
VKSADTLTANPPVAAGPLADGATARNILPAKGSERDLRLDFWRGVALLIIFIDHVPDNPLARWTLKNYAFCDAAEIFVLISGISTYLAYASQLERGGMRALYGVVGRRMLKIYTAHIAMLLAVAALLLVAARLSGRAEYAASFRMGWLLSDPLTALPAALSLRYLPNLFDILPLYADCARALDSHVYGRTLDRIQLARRQHRRGLDVQSAYLAAALYDRNRRRPLAQASRLRDAAGGAQTRDRRCACVRGVCVRDGGAVART